jgi:hypothetical protein
MKTAILSVLLLLAVAYVVSGAPAESGKSRYGHETCLAIMLQKLQLNEIVSLFNYELRHDVWRNVVKRRDVLVTALETKVQVA